MILAGKALDPDVYFIVSPNMLSSSPSHTPQPYGRGRFPTVTFVGQVQAQRVLLTSLVVSSLALAIGSSFRETTLHWMIKK